MTRKMALMDWRAMKYYHIRGFLLPAFILLIGMMTSSLLVMPTGALVGILYSQNPFAMEEKGSLDRLYLTLPVKRGDIVSGRFLLGGIMGLICMAVSVPIMLLVNTIGSSHYYMPLSWYVSIVAVSYFLFSAFCLATYPLLFKLGYQKGKVFGTLLPSAFIGVLYVGYMLFFEFSGPTSMVMYMLEYAYNHMLLVSGGIFALATALLALSYILSKRIYEKRDC